MEILKKSQSFIHLYVDDLKKSSSYFDLLGFSKISNFKFKNHFNLVSDGSCNVLLDAYNDKGNNDDDKEEHDGEYIVLTDNYEELVKYYKQEKIEMKKDAHDNIMLVSASGFVIKFIDGKDIFEDGKDYEKWIDVFNKLESVSLFTFKELQKREKYPNQTLGIYGEYSHSIKEGNKLEDEVEWYKKVLGLNGEIMKHGNMNFAILYNQANGFVVGLHGSRDTVMKPTITYFGCWDRSKDLIKEWEGIKEIPGAPGNHQIYGPNLNSNIFLMKF